MSTVRWGIAGTGGIAATFADDLRLLDGAEVVAVGSRSQQRADEFAKEHSVERAHPTYAALAEDDDVDVVYVEKPFTMDAAEAESLVSAARSRGVFMMEAMWARFVPHMVRVRELLAEGALGDIRVVLADHCQWFPDDPEHRLLAPELGGGALLDLGIYPISFASMVLGTPTTVTAVGERAFTGVDATTSVLLQHEGGAHAVLTTTLSAAGPNRAAIVGTEARIEIDRTWYAPTTFRLVTRDGEVTDYAEPSEPRGMQYEAAEVGRCLREGLLESPILPLEETVSIMATMDEIRAQIGLTYPGE
jgi:predicted dehydrogenase